MESATGATMHCTMPNRLFLLSPANCSGRRAEILLREQATFDLATRLRTTGASLGETFSFLSGLYFRGKVAYSGRFGCASEGIPSALVITAGRGLLPPETIVTMNDLKGFASVPVDLQEPRYREPLIRDAGSLAGRIGSECQIVLLGSVATLKYQEILIGAFANRVYYPIDFIGRGDLSRGGLMLRCAAEGRELEYAPITGEVLRGSRPARLQRNLETKNQRPRSRTTVDPPAIDPTLEPSPLSSRKKPSDVVGEGA